LYKVDPAVLNRRFNLFAKDNVRTALGDEVVEGWPKVPLVRDPASLADI
jgi:hypothetical protein